MNLKQFAINRKLTHNHKLLDYVVDDKPVPCDVLEDSLKEFIEPLHDKTSEMLSDDYQTMLKDTVPIIITKDGNGGHVISGDVPDVVLEAIQLVHKVSPEDAIEEMIKANMLEINNQKVTVTNVSLKEQALVMATQMHNIPPVQDVVATAPTMVVETAPTMTVEAPATVEATVEAAVETQTNETPATVGEIVDTIQPITTMATTTMATTAVEDDGLPFETNDGTLITAQDEPDGMGVETQPDEGGINMGEAVRRIYDKLLRDIKLYNLDKSLNLDM